MSDSILKLIQDLEAQAGGDAILAVSSASSIPELIDQCGKTAKEHGFHDVHADQAKGLVGQVLRNEGCLDVAEGLEVKITKALEDAELVGDPFIFMALINTECAEACEAIRKGNWCNKDGAWEELADVFIRAFDFISRYGAAHDMDGKKFLQLIKAKMAKNESRPHLHGKRF